MSNKLSEVLNLQKAYETVLSDERLGSDFVPDVILFVDSKQNKKELLAQISKELDHSEYTVKRLIKMDIPKKNFCIRKGGRPCLEDWIIYQAIVYHLAPKIDHKLSSSVFSVRFDRKSQRFRRGVKQWLEFQKQFWEIYDSGYEHVLLADISSYFANINLEKLRKALIGLTDQSKISRAIIDLLFEKFLRVWSRDELNVGYGLPEGSSASSFLGNIFLWQIDVKMSRARNRRYLRYMDDIRVLTRTKIEAKIALKELINNLRELGFDVNAAKTRIVPHKKVRLELHDVRNQELDLIDHALNSKDEEIIKMVQPLLWDVFKGSSNPANNFAERHLKFSLNRYVRLRRRFLNRRVNGRIGIQVLEYLLSNLNCLPSFTNLFCKFIRNYNDETTRKKLIKFLRSPENIYDWQEMWILDAFLRFKRFTRNDIRLFKRIGFDKNKHPMCRARAILLLGKFGEESDRLLLRSKFNEEEDYLIQRAIIIAAQELSEAERNDFYSLVKRDHTSQRGLISWIKKLRKPMYYFEYPITPIPIEEEAY